MTITQIDHFVLTTRSLADCLHFYVDILDLRHEECGGRHALFFGRQKINLHQRKGEYQPAASHPEYGCLDFCLTVEEDVNRIKTEIEAKGYPVEAGPVTRHGARGEMQSLYLRDPDGNLVELSHYE
jgi:catechol 2,3-dioxygenase-like lactoylglutathione lyase family enzyme